MHVEVKQQQQQQNHTHTHIHDLLEVLNNPTKFQLNWIRTTTKNQLKLFNNAVTLKYNQGQ